MAPTALTPELVSHLTSHHAPLLKRAAALLSSTHTLVERAEPTPTPWQKCKGCRSPDSFNNRFYFALFAILGIAIVAGSIWFFFFARNGGFQYEEGDWEDYKTAVLRRKGPDGKTVVSSRSARSVKTGMTRQEEKWEQARWAAMSVVARDEKGRKGILAKRGWGGTHSCTYRDDFTQYDGGDRRYEMTEVGSLPDYDMPIPTSKKTKTSHKEKKSSSKKTPVPGAWNIDLEASRPAHPAHGHGHHSRRYADRDQDVRSYAHEKPARVGGMNRTADGSHMDFSGSEISSSNGRSSQDPRHARAEKRVLTEAEKMERQWRREARRAARELERGEASQGSSRTSSPIKRGGAGGQQRRTPSPKKRETGRQGREYSFSKPEGESYLNAYRPGR